MEGDDTGGHVDTLVRFCNPNTLAYVQCDNPDEIHYSSLQAMEKVLKALRTLANEPYKLIPLPLPQAQYDAANQRLPATYANFLIINDRVLLPTYQDPADQLAKSRLQTAFPNHQIIMIDCRPLIQQFGSLHCATMQLPAGTCRLPKHHF